MSVQPPPTNIGTPLYNQLFYINPNADDNGITPAYLDQNYLRFPSAQGTEEFPNGLFSVGAIDFNSPNGNDRTITGLSNSSFTDILGNGAYTAYIEENSTTIGSYNGGLIIHSSDTIDLQGVNVLINGLPISTGGDVYTNQNNAFTGNNSFSSPATSQSFNSQTVNINGGSITMKTSGSLYPITITNQSTTAADNELVFSPNVFQDAGTYKFQTYESGYINRLTIDYTGLKLVGAPFKSNLNTTPTLTQLPNNYSCFYSNNEQPYFAYNNAGTINTTNLYQTNILGTYTSDAIDTAVTPFVFTFNSIPNTLGQQFHFVVYSNTSKTNNNSPYVLGSTLSVNSAMINEVLVVGNASLLPFKFSNGAIPVPTITNTSGYVMNAPTNIGGFTLASIVIDASTTGISYRFTTPSGNFTNGSRLILVAYNYSI